MAGTSSQFSKQKTIKNSTSFGQTGDWVEVVSLLSNTFAVTTDTEYSMQLEQTDGTVFVASKLSATFMAGSRSQFSKQKTIKNQRDLHPSRERRDAELLLSNTFAVTTDTEYSMQL